MTKPILLLDMDGPMADFDIACWEHMQRSRMELDITEYGQVRHRYITDHLRHEADRASVRRTINHGRWFWSLPVTPGAQMGVELLRDHFEVWVCTKPLEANENCWSDKLAWLRLHFPALADRMILAPNKTLVRGDVLLDDAIPRKWIIEADRLPDWTPVVFKAPFNSEFRARDNGLIGSEEVGLRWEWGMDVERLLMAAEFAIMRRERRAS